MVEVGFISLSASATVEPEITKVDTGRRENREGETDREIDRDRS